MISAVTHYNGAPRASGAKQLRKFGKLFIREILVATSAYAHTLFGGKGKGIGWQPVGGGVCYIFLAGNLRCICTTRVFLGWQSRKKWCDHCRRVQKLVYRQFSAISQQKDFVTVVLSFQLTVFKKILWQQTITEFKLFAFFFLVKSEGQEKEEKGREQELKILTTVTRNLAIARFLCKYSRPF